MFNSENQSRDTAYTIPLTIFICCALGALILLFFYQYSQPSTGSSRGLFGVGIIFFVATAFISALEILDQLISAWHGKQSSHPRIESDDGNELW